MIRSSLQRVSSLILFVIFSSSALGIDNGVYTITAKYSGKLVEVGNASTSNAANVNQWPANGHATQQWRISNVSGNDYSVINNNSGKAMEVYAFNTADGANVVQYDYWGGEPQLWTITDRGNGYFSFINRFSGKALDLLGWDTSDGANIGVWSYWGGDTQLWSLSAISTAGGSDPDTNTDWSFTTQGDNFSHDPSRIIESEGRFYVFSTRPDYANSSADGITWVEEPSPLPNGFPSWLSSVITTDNQGVWAPDIIYYRGRYLYYYSVCGVGAGSACAIGLRTATTLNSSSPNFGWQDAGLVLTNPPNNSTIQFSTIDAAPIVDTNGNLWIAWGSGYGKDASRNQLFVTRMNNDTGLPLTSDPSYNPPAQQGYPLKTGTREGAYIHYRNGYYYLFWNEGSCCSGTSSTYTMFVSRSTNITGPYTGDRRFFATTAGRNGPGHIGIYSQCGIERFTYHYYPDAYPRLGVNKLLWSSDGWPVVGAPIAVPMTPCGQ